MKLPYTIKELKEKINNVTYASDPFIEKLLLDERKGVQRLVKQRLKAIEKQQSIIEAHHERLQFENQLYTLESIHSIAGIDEVGRGPLAGPVVAAAVILPKDTDKLLGINDSKQLSLKQREHFASLIKEEAVSYSIAEVTAQQIDKLNIYEATRLAMTKAVEQLDTPVDYLLLDAMTIQTSIPQQSIIKGDQRSLSIAAASIIAKVYRDHLMIQYGEHYPEFGFESHMGYGTKQHLDALNTYGYTPIHRHSFSPVANIHKPYSL